MKARTGLAASIMWKEPGQEEQLLNCVAFVCRELYSGGFLCIHEDKVTEGFPLIAGNDVCGETQGVCTSPQTII